MSIICTDSIYPRYNEKVILNDCQTRTDAVDQYDIVTKKYIDDNSGAYQTTTADLISTGYPGTITLSLTKLGDIITMTFSTGAWVSPAGSGDVYGPPGTIPEDYRPSSLVKTFFRDESSYGGTTTGQISIMQIYTDGGIFLEGKGYFDSANHNWVGNVMWIQ